MKGQHEFLVCRPGSALPGLTCSDFGRNAASQPRWLIALGAASCAIFGHPQLNASLEAS